MQAKMRKLVLSAHSHSTIHSIIPISLNSDTQQNEKCSTPPFHYCFTESVQVTLTAIVQMHSIGMLDWIVEHLHKSCVQEH